MRYLILYHRNNMTGEEQLDAIANKIDVQSGYDAYLSTQSDFPHDLVAIYAADFCQYEVCNGGFRQFFWNSAGIVGPEALEGFALLGMPGLGQIVADAMAKLGEEYPRERKNRWDAMLGVAGISKEQRLSLFARTAEMGGAELLAAFREAIPTRLFNDSDKAFYRLIATENGGYDAALERYLKSLPE